MSDLPTLLLVLAVGLTVGAVAMLALHRMREQDDKIAEAIGVAHTARDAANASQRSIEKLNTHDHEIAALYQRAGLKRQ